MEKVNYSFEEFEKHYDDLAAAIHSDNSPSMIAATLRVKDYMDKLYSEHEALLHTQLFMLIVMELSHTVEEYDQGDLAVVGSPKVGALVSRHLFKAIHHVMTEHDLGEPRTRSPERIIALAEQFRETDKNVEQT